MSGRSAEASGGNLGNSISKACTFSAHAFYNALHVGAEKAAKILKAAQTHYLAVCLLQVYHI